MSGTPEVIVGKTITGVIMKKSKRSSPSAQLFLLFDDNSHFEFWSWGEYSGMNAAGGLDRGGVEEVRKYMSTSMEIVFEKHAIIAENDGA
jgi:hypothetical protein